MIRQPKSHAERGFSLTEVLVAMAILVVVFVGILMLYDRANRVFRSSSEAADLQQNVRVAYDRMVADIRMAGFDYKRGGPLMPGQTAAPWAPNRSYAAGTIVTPTTPNGHTYRATNAGTSSGSQPAWPTGTGATVVENLATPPITWQENGGAVYEQPDEQIEFAGQTALTLRANLDYSAKQPGDGEHGRETSLEKPQFPLVTTGNDEIVTYALVSDRAAAGTAPNNQSVMMYVDVNNGGAPARTAHPGGTAENQKTITGVDLTNANPPYTLYRFTFAADGSVRRTPLADNIRSLNFFYYEDEAGRVPLRDLANTNLVSNIGGDGQYNPTTPASLNHPDRLLRRKVRAVRVRLVGMNAVSDPAYVDTSTATGQFSATTTAGVPVFVADTVAPNFRRITLDTLISPRNLGRTGLPQTFLEPPPVPDITSVCIGYCGIAVVNWNPNTNNPNASYVVMWDTDAAGSFSNSYNAGTSNTYAVDLTQEDLTQTFYFKVRAFNAGGGSLSPVSSGVFAKNATVPSPPHTLVASGGATPAIPGKIRVTWAAPTTNASGATSCSPSGTPVVNTFIREIKGFRVYRGTTPGFNANSSSMLIDEDESGATAPTTDGYGNFAWEDETVACGQPYYYRVQAVEWCVSNAAHNQSNNISASISATYPASGNNGIMGQSGTAGVPAPPVNLAVDVANSSCDPGTNLCNVTLNWSRVTQDTVGGPVAIDVYDIERVQFLVGVPTGVPQPPLTLTGALAQPGNTIVFTDISAERHDVVSLLTYEYKYRVRAMQINPCPDGDWSGYVDYPPPCTFTGSVIVQTGASSGDGLTPGTAWVMDTGDTIQITPPVGTTFTNTNMAIVGGGAPPPVDSTDSPALFTWANLTPGTVYQVTFTMINDAVPPCQEQIVRYVQQESPPGCALETFANQNSILRTTATDYVLQLDLVNRDSEDLNLESIRFSWNQPARTAWNNIKFPSTPTATVALGGSPPATFTVPLNPKPAQLSTADVTVPSNGTRSLLLNFARTSGPNSPPGPNVITDICITYTRVSFPGEIWNCKIKPDAAANNPTTCD